jgi:hypothetical protein
MILIPLTGILKMLISGVDWAARPWLVLDREADF